MKRKKPMRDPIKIPLDFKQTVLAALETPPEKRPNKKRRKSQNPPKKAG